MFQDASIFNSEVFGFLRIKAWLGEQIETVLTLCSAWRIAGVRSRDEISPWQLVRHGGS